MNKEKNAAAVALGRIGGSKTSPAKAAAVAANGRLGGRPKVTKADTGTAGTVWFEVHYQGSRCQIVERKFASSTERFLVDHDGSRILIGDGELQKFFADRPAAVAKATEWQRWQIEGLRTQLAEAEQALKALK